MFTIKVHYQTGSSFYSEDTDCLIEHEWSNLDMAKKSLERIKNHYEYYTKHSNLYEEPTETMPSGVTWNNEFRFLQLLLVDDHGNDFKYSADWCGYFETLYGADIVASRSDNNGMSFSI